MAPAVIQTLIFVYLFHVVGPSFAPKRAAYFKPETVSDQQPVITYKSLSTSSYFGLDGPISQIQCMTICVDDDGCRSFHMNGEACVLGVTDDVSHEIRQAPTITPDSTQRLQVKSKNFKRST